MYTEHPRTYDGMYKWMSKLCLIHGAVKYGEEEQVMEFNNLSLDDVDSDDENGDVDDMGSEEEI